MKLMEKLRRANDLETQFLNTLLIEGLGIAAIGLFVAE